MKQPKPYMRTDGDILMHIFEIVQELDGRGLIITEDDKSLFAEIKSMSEFICNPLRDGLYTEESED